MSLASEISEFIRQQIELYGDEFALNADLLSVSNSSESAPIETWQSSVSLEELLNEIHQCQKCPLGQNRKKIVFGTGNPNADIMLIGEAPGATEDEMGLPFVGEAGQLLDNILAAIDLSREQVYICNILKCRPPFNRDPQRDEIEICLPYLRKQIELVNPAFILCLGRISAHTILETQSSLSALRNRVHKKYGVRVIVTYHPAALLRYPEYKRNTWEDVKLLRRLYDVFIEERNQS